MCSMSRRMVRAENAQKEGLGEGPLRRLDGQWGGQGGYRMDHGPCKENCGRQMGPSPICHRLHGLEPKSYLDAGLAVRPLFQKNCLPRCWPKTLELTAYTKELGLKQGHLFTCFSITRYTTSLPPPCSSPPPPRPITLQEAKEKLSLELPLLAKPWEGSS